MKFRRIRIVYIGLIFGIALSVFSLFGVVSGFQRAAAQARAEFRDDIVWYATQYRAELNVLTSALQGYLQGSSLFTPDDIVDRFDVFWSRLESSGNGALGRKFERIEDANETVDEALALLKRYETVVSTLEQADTEDIRTLLAQLVSLHGRFQSLALAALRAKTFDQEALYQQQSESARQIVIFLAGIVTLGASLLMLLRIEKKNGERLGRDLEQRVCELEAAQQELLKAERLATLGELTATVSHELRNPLGTIYSSCALLRRRLTTLEPGFTNVLDRIERNIKRCTNIIDELLDYTRTRELNLEQTEIDAWVKSVVRGIEVPEQVEMVYDLSSGVSAPLDTERIRQVLVNLIDNAWQSMTDPPEPLNRVRITVSSEASDKRVLIHVADTGPGIAQDKHEKIFEPLYSTRSFGVGLGLPLVRRIMEQHGGSIELQTRCGCGTTFTLSLPLAVSEEPSEER